jgi:hypothetical protein
VDSRENLPEPRFGIPREEVEDILTLLPRPLEEIDADFAYFASHHDELARSYPDVFVAIMDGAVVAHGDRVEAVLAKLEARGLDPRSPVIAFVEATPRHLVL